METRRPRKGTLAQCRRLNVFIDMHDFVCFMLGESLVFRAPQMRPCGGGSSIITPQRKLLTAISRLWARRDVCDIASDDSKGPCVLNCWSDDSRKSWSSFERCYHHSTYRMDTSTHRHQGIRQKNPNRKHP